ncbi:MAG: hypothetical protein DI601_02465 [Azospirillum brasilense]|nr:MAG: hypothetical protein DI601_02465 [Azospirillum brasilense]
MRVSTPRRSAEFHLHCAAGGGMFVVLGATGHVGSAVAWALLDAGERVTVVTRSEEKADSWHEQGAEAVLADAGDADQLRRGQRAFLLNPAAAPSMDTEREEHRTAASIVAALADSGLEQVVAASTYCARPGEQVGDLGVLHGFEQALLAQPPTGPGPARGLLHKQRGCPAERSAWRHPAQPVPRGPAHSDGGARGSRSGCSTSSRSITASTRSGSPATTGPRSPTRCCWTTRWPRWVRACPRP